MHRCVKSNKKCVAKSVRFFFAWMHQDQVSQESTHAPNVCRACYSKMTRKTCWDDDPQPIIIEIQTLNDVRGYIDESHTESSGVKCLNKYEPLLMHCRPCDLGIMYTLLPNTEAKLNAIIKTSWQIPMLSSKNFLTTTIIQNRWTRQIRITCRIACKKWVKIGHFTRNRCWLSKRNVSQDSGIFESGSKTGLRRCR